MAIAADYIERAQIIIEPRDGVPRDDGPAGRAAPRTPAGSTPPTEKIPSVGAKHISDCRLDGVEVKVVDSITVGAIVRCSRSCGRLPSIVHASTLVTECVVDAGRGTLIRRVTTQRLLARDRRSSSRSCWIHSPRSAVTVRRSA